MPLQTTCNVLNPIIGITAGVASPLEPSIPAMFPQRVAGRTFGQGGRTRGSTVLPSRLISGLTTTMLLFVDPNCPEYLPNSHTLDCPCLVSYKRLDPYKRLLWRDAVGMTYAFSGFSVPDGTISDGTISSASTCHQLMAWKADSSW